MVNQPVVNCLGISIDVYYTFSFCNDVFIGVEFGVINNIASFNSFRSGILNNDHSRTLYV